jgi:lipoprotein-anchoring transpeptidase ErfK/SrfK
MPWGKEIQTMRRLVLPVKTSAVAAILLAGAVYVAAEARQAVVRRQELELVRLEDGFDTIPVATNPVIGRSGDRVIGSHPVSSPERNIAPSPSQPESKLDLSKPGQNTPRATAKDDHSREIVISIPDRRLALLQDGELIKTYPIAVGTRWTPSPEGEFTIINHAVDPVYRHKGKQIPPGDDNPLGDRWMGLSLKGYGIHGTNVPRSVGKAASHGCFRMARQDVEELYAQVKVGDRVIVRRERDELIARVFGPQENAPPASSATEVQMASAVRAGAGGASASPSGTPQ